MTYNESALRRSRDINAKALEKPDTLSSARLPAAAGPQDVSKQPRHSLASSIIASQRTQSDCERSPAGQPRESPGEIIAPPAQNAARTTTGQPRSALVN